MTVIELDALPAMDVAGRAGRLRAALADAGIDALLVTHLVNVRYLTGFTGSAGDAARHRPTRSCSSPTAATATQAGEQLAAAGVDAEIEIGATVAQQRDALRGARSRPARASGSRPTRSPGRSSATSPTVLDGHELVAHRRPRRGAAPGEGAGEVARIHAACAIADDALGALLPAPARAARPSATSRSTSSSRCAGAAPAATASSRSSRRARTAPSRTPARAPGTIEAGELVVIDFGCIVDGYCSDMTRTVSVGDPGPDARARLGRRAREPAGGPRRGARRRRLRRRSTGRVATSSPTRDGPTRSCTAPATAWASRSTRSPGWPRVPVIPWPPVRSSPSSPACTSPAWAACASRTPWSSPPTAPIPSPHSRRN